MTKEDSLKMLVLVRRMGTLMEEFQTASQQLAQSLDRNDDVSIRLSLSMRQEALDAVQQTKREIVRQMGLLPSQLDKERLKTLLNAGEPDDSAEEQALAERVTANIRLHDRITELDRAISRKLARDRSVYAK